MTAALKQQISSMRKLIDLMGGEAKLNSASAHDKHKQQKQRGDKHGRKLIAY